MNEQIENQKPVKISLATFVEENQKLLTVIGVFTAVTLFATNIKILYMATILSFLFLLLTLLLWIELINKFPKTGSAILGWFEAILGICILGLIFYWLVEYREIWQVVLPFFFQLILILILSYIIKKTNLFNRIFKAKPGQKIGWRYIVYFAIMLTTLYIGLYVGYIISPPIINFFGILKEGLK